MRWMDVQKQSKTGGRTLPERRFDSEGPNTLWQQEVTSDRTAAL